MVRVRILCKLNICFSSSTGASIARNDGMSVISFNHSTCLAHKVLDLGTFDFQGYNPLVRVRILLILE